jgi:hypothetical protein
MNEGGRYYLAYGGGLGDVIWDYTHDPIASALPYFVGEKYCRVTVITQCHNPGVEDLFWYHPYITHHIVEEWKPPTSEEASRLSNVIDEMLPLQREQLPFQYDADPPTLYLSAQEKALVRSLLRGQTVVVQPFAGLSERDAFNGGTLEMIVNSITAAVPDVTFLILGQDHGRLTDARQRQRIERVTFAHPNMVDLIGKTSMRVNYHLTRNCSAFIGSFSNLVRTAWDANRTSVVVVDPILWDSGRIPRTDRRYTYGWELPNVTRMDARKEWRDLDIHGLCTPIIRQLQSPQQSTNLFA